MKRSRPVPAESIRNPQSKIPNPQSRLPLAAGLVSAFAGANIQLLTHIPWVRVVGWVLIIAGLAASVWYAFRYATLKPAVRRSYLASRVVHRLLLRGRLLYLMPHIGLLVIAGDLLFNTAYQQSLNFGSQDWAALALGGAFIAYPYIPHGFRREADFTLLFLALLVFTVGLPLGLTQLITSTPGQDPKWYTFHLLGRPVAALVNLSGVYSYAFADSLVIEQRDGVFVRLILSRECAGLVSMALFSSGFVAFLFVEFRRVEERFILLFGLGLFTAYWANILRVWVIAMVGANYGRDAMLATHENAGVFIFLGWVGLFWGGMYYLLKRKRSEPLDRSPQAVP